MTNKDVQHLLAKIFFGSDDKKYLQLVVPKQGNLKNPQQLTNCSAYFMFYIKSYTKKLTNPTTGNTEHYANLLVDIELQCVGSKSEEFMLSTMFWDERSDVRKCFDAQSCVLLESPRTITCMPYFQDGANTVLVYTTTLRLAETISCEETLELLKECTLEGNLIIEA